MPDAPTRVEVACPFCRIVGDGANVKFREGFCNHCVNTRKQGYPVAPGSLTEAMMQLAEACVAYYDVVDDDNRDDIEGLDPFVAFQTALARVRTIKAEGG